MKTLENAILVSAIHDSMRMVSSAPPNFPWCSIFGHCRGEIQAELLKSHFWSILGFRSCWVVKFFMSSTRIVSKENDLFLLKAQVALKHLLWFLCRNRPDLLTLRVGEEVKKEKLALQEGSSYEYEVRGLQLSKWYEIKISYPASVCFSSPPPPPISQTTLGLQRATVNTSSVIVAHWVLYCVPMLQQSNFCGVEFFKFFQQL